MEDDQFQSHRFLFFLDEKGNSRSVTPSEVRKVVHEIFPFPINVNRHYLRTELVERGCIPDITDAFMGHAHRGREPWNQFSSLSPQGYAKEVGPKLIEIIRENGWKAIRSSTEA